MATQEKTWNVANRLHSLKDSDNPEVNHIIAGADEIYDDTKGAKQSDINAQTDAALADRYTKAETYSKEQLDSLITTPDANYVTVATFADLPQTGEGNTVYRVSSYDGTQMDASKYALYAWNGTVYQLLAVRSAVGEVFDVSEYNSHATYETLAVALAAVPTSVQRGGMSIKFILRTNTGTEEEPVYHDEYVQYLLKKTAWSDTPSDWESIDGNNTIHINDAQHLTDTQKAQALDNMGIGGIDDAPTANSDNLVRSGGVQNELALGTVYDVSAKNPTAGPNNDGKFESLSALLSDTNLNTLIPTVYRKGGMSIKFVQSSDNKYVQYMLIKDSWSTYIGYWKKVNLEDEVTQLEGKVDGLEINLLKIEGTVITQGERCTNTGAIMTDANYWRTNTIPVIPGDILTSVGNNTGLYFNFYFYNSPYIGTSTFVSNISGRKATIPSSASFVVITNVIAQNPSNTSIVCKSTDITTEYPFLGMNTIKYGVYYKKEADAKFATKQELSGAVETINQSIGLTNQDLRTLDDEVNGREINLLKLPDTVITTGERTDNSGNIYADAAFWRTNAIPIAAGTEITSVGMSVNSAFRFAFYSSNVISSSNFVSLVEGRKATAPNGATYLVVAAVIANNPANTSIVCNAEDISTEYPTYGMNTILGGMYDKNEIDTKFAVVTSIKEKTDSLDIEVNGREVNMLKWQGTQIIDGSRVMNNGDIYADANYWRTNCIPVTPGDVLKTAFSNSGQVPYFAFYNSKTPYSGTFISGGQATSATVPEGASYVLIYNSNTVKSGAILCNEDDISNPTYGMNTILGGMYDKDEVDTLIETTKAEIEEDIVNSQPAKWRLATFELEIYNINSKHRVLYIDKDDVLYGSDGYNGIFKATKVNLSDIVTVVTLPSNCRLSKLLFISSSKAVGYVRNSVDTTKEGMYVFDNADTNSWTARKTGEMDYGFCGDNFQSLILADNGYLFASEYSIKSATRASNKIYRSTDGGETWSACYTHIVSSNTHMHAIEFDVYRQRVWCAIGDYGNNPEFGGQGRPGWAYSDDYGDTWDFVEAGTGQTPFMDTAIIPTRRYVLFGSDYHPAGIRKWEPANDIKHATVFASEVSTLYKIPVSTSNNFGFARTPVVDISEYPYKIIVAFSYNASYSHACLLFSPDFKEWHMMDYVADPNTDYYWSALSGITSDGWVMGYDEQHEKYRYFKFPGWVKN